MSDLLARLIHAGTPPELVAEVAMEMARAEAAKEAIDSRKLAEAARTERYRSRGGGNIDPAVRRAVMERDNYTCQDCSATDNLCCDHIIPVSKGGGSEEENLQVLCKPCNSRKKDRIRKQDERKLSENVQGKARTSSLSEDIQIAPLSLSPNENNSNPHTHTPGEIIPRARKGDFPKPDWADGEVWADFLKNRKAKRLQNTATAHKGFLEDIARIATDEWPPGRLLRHAATKGWGAIYEPDEMKHGRLSGNPGISGLQRPDPLRSALADAIAECEAEERQCSAANQADYPGSFAALPAH